MDDFRRVLAALDLGPHGDAVTRGSLAALRRAVWIAKRMGSSLTLVHSDKADEYYDPDSGAFVDGVGVDPVRQSVLDKALADVRREGVDANLEIRSESAWLAIVRLVLRDRIDVVVASKRASDHADGRELGTVVRKLLRKCPCAVWLEDLRRPNEPTVILAATDLMPVGDRVVALAAAVAKEVGASLHVVHAFSLTAAVQLEGGQARQDYIRRVRGDATRRIESILETVPLASAAGLHIGLASPTQAILDGVNTLKPGLVVMGTVSRGGIPGLLIGNTAERLFDRVDCAILAVKPDNFVCPVSIESELDD